MKTPQSLSDGARCHARGPAQGLPVQRVPALAATAMASYDRPLASPLPLTTFRLSPMQLTHILCRRVRRGHPAQVPLLWTVYALVSFRQFRVLPPDSVAAGDGFFEPPPQGAARERPRARRGGRRRRRPAPRTGASPGGPRGPSCRAGAGGGRRAPAFLGSFKPCCGPVHARLSSLGKGVEDDGHGVRRRSSGGRALVAPSLSRPCDWRGGVGPLQVGRAGTLRMLESTVPRAACRPATVSCQQRHAWRAQSCGCCTCRMPSRGTCGLEAGSVAIGGPPRSGGLELPACMYVHGSVT